MPITISNPDKVETPPLGSHNLILFFFYALLMLVLRRSANHGPSVKRRVRGILILALAVSALGMLQATPAFAAGVVGNGTPASCTEAALDAVIAGQVESIKFNCGPAVKTITLTTTKLISYATTIDGGKKIILDAKNVRHFIYSNPKVYTLKNITLKNGKADKGGAIWNDEPLTLINVRFEKNTATVTGGAIYNTGTLTIRKAKFAGNTANNGGGAIYNESGGNVLTLQNSTFFGNKAQTDNSVGGALFSQTGSVVIAGGAFNNNSAAYGGALFKYQGSLTAVGTQFIANKSAAAGAIYINADGGDFESIWVERNAAAGGAGLVSQSSINVAKSTILNNTATNIAGGIAAFQGKLTMDQTTVSGNKAPFGAGMYITGDFEIYHSTISGNIASSDGGGAWVYGFGTIGNSTLSGNQAGANGKGGAWLQTNENTDFNFVTIANNKAGKGGGIALDDDQQPLQQERFDGFPGAANPAAMTTRVFEPTMHLQNTLLAKNSGGNCYGSHDNLGTRGYNLSDNNSCKTNFTAGTDFNNTDPKLGPLANNGGATLTHLPAKNSIVVNHGFTMTFYTNDQRGEQRPSSSNADIGAVEVQLPAAQ